MLSKRLFSSSQVTIMSPQHSAVNRIERLKQLQSSYARMQKLLEMEETQQTSLQISQKHITKANQFFYHKDQSKQGLQLVHKIAYGQQLKDFRIGIEKDDYHFYDEYLLCKEVMIVGSSNSGKTSLINALNDDHKVGKVAKRSAKTQALHFYLCQKSQHREKKNPNEVWRGFILDSPGYGYTYAPLKVKNEFKKLMSGYLSHSVRLSLVLMLVNANTGLRHCDIEMLEQLEYY